MHDILSTYVEHKIFLNNSMLQSKYLSGITQFEYLNNRISMIISSFLNSKHGKLKSGDKI